MRKQFLVRLLTTVALLAVLFTAGGLFSAPAHAQTKQASNNAIAVQAAKHAVQAQFTVYTEALQAKVAAHTMAPTYNTICQPYYNYWHAEYVAYTYLNFDLCYNGSSVWKGSWGPNCTYWVTIPGYSATSTWCGIWQPNSSYLEVGSNTTYSSKWGSFSCWYRVGVNANGQVTRNNGC